MCEIWYGLPRFFNETEQSTSFIYLYNGTQILTRFWSFQMQQFVYTENSSMKKPLQGDIKILVWE